MKRILLFFVASIGVAHAEQAPATPSQQMVGQLATALAASQDREADLRAQVTALQAQITKPTPPAPPAPEPPKKP